MKKVGMVGCGGIAHVHAKILKKLQGVNLIAFADCRKDRSELFAELYGTEGANHYESLEEMLEEEQLDVVHICTPHYLHVPMAMEIVGHQIQVFMEKPPAITRMQFLELEGAESQSEASVGVCFQNRYNRTTLEVERQLRSGDVGKIRCARAFVTWNRPETYYTNSDWRGTAATEGGGALINQSVHTLDLLVRFLGQPEWVEASMHNHHLKQVIEVEDTVEAYIQFSDATACFYATTSYGTDSPVLLELECEYARLRLEGNQVTCNYRDGSKTETICDETDGLGKSYWGDGHEACIRDYYDSLERGSIIRNNLQSVENTFRLMMDIYQSAKERKVVSFEKERETVWSI